MKGHISPEKIEEVKRRADIVDLVSEYVTLKKGGKNFLGLCPFHKEKTPSFTVNRDKQIFYCFGCGEGGNVVSFLMKINNMSFPEAVRHLAGKTGVVIPERVLTREEKEHARTREEISRINRMAANFFSETLFSGTGKGARAYLKKRGIKDEAVKEFNLGYAADGWRNLKEYFEKSNVPLNLVERAGLIIAKSNGGGSYYDRFRGRLIFPIEDAAGNVIAFGGRILGEGEPKYLNTPESLVFFKGRNLYGLNRTKEDIRRRGYAILVEGYFDLITLWSAGTRNTVATLGTALTKEHIDLLRRYTNEVIALFDPDVAGKKALARSIELFLSGNVHAKAVVLPEGYDPDQYVRTYGNESLEGVVSRAQSMVDYYIENFIGRVDTVEEKRDAMREAVSFIVNIGDIGERDLFIRRVSEKLGLHQERLIKEVNRTLTVSAGKSVDAIREPDMDIDTVELSLIHIMLEYPLKIPEIVRGDMLDFFMSSNMKSLALRLRDSFEKENAEDFDASLFIQNIEHDAIQQKLLKKMVNENPYTEEIIDRIITDTLTQMKRKWYKEKRRMLTIEMKKADERGNHELSNRLLLEKERLLREEKALQ